MDANAESVKILAIGAGIPESEAYQRTHPRGALGPPGGHHARRP